MTTLATTTSPFAAVVQTAMRRIQWGQRKLAREANLNVSVVHRVVTGAVEPDGKTMTAIAQVLNLAFVDGRWQAAEDVDIDRIALQVKLARAARANKNEGLPSHD